ncbi:trehalase-like domain-containing protein [Actinomadura luteofluorescens]|uniref:trehalase-like domain-containing protein n=1 Tax=Actinomadura luteofluorescens TaxID=46163 RepID=UPI00362BA8B4
MQDDFGAKDSGPKALRDYALIADGERGALVGPHGEYAWMCFPVWDSPPAFAGLLGGPGAYVVQPGPGRWVWGGYYEDRGLIWHSRWVTGDGAILECREALARSAAPGRAVILRRCRAVRGRSRVRALLDVRTGHGAPRMRDVRRDGPEWTARGGGASLRWRGADEAVVRDGDGGGPVLDLAFDLDEGRPATWSWRSPRAGAAARWTPRSCGRPPSGTGARPCRTAATPSPRATPASPTPS